MPTGERREEVARLVEGGSVKIEVEDTSGQRVSNARIKDELGVALRYPDYRAGLRALLEEPA